MTSARFDTPQDCAANIFNNRSPQQRVAPTPQASPVPHVPAPTPTAPAPTPSSSTSLEELVRMMILQNMQVQQETRASIQTMRNQMGKMAMQLNQA